MRFPWWEEFQPTLGFDLQQKTPERTPLKGQSDETFQN